MSPELELNIHATVSARKWMFRLFSFGPVRRMIMQRRTTRALLQHGYITFTWPNRPSHFTPIVSLQMSKQFVVICSRKKKQFVVT
jgi:hypothetical protein